MAWLAAKPLEWHQQMYSLLYRELSPVAEFRRPRPLRIVRLSNGRYGVGSRSYFPSDDVEHDETLPRVAKGVYTFGNNKQQQEEARKFLETIGVREVGEAEQVQAMLMQRYTTGAFNPDMKDLKRFIALVEKVPAQSKMFADYFIFRLSDEKWGKPSQTYIDSPFMATGLSAYYEAHGPNSTRVALSDSYQQGPVPTDKLLKFAMSVGVQYCLEITPASCRDNPAALDLVWRAPGGWSRWYGVDQDYTIAGLQQVLNRNSEALSRLVWKTACDQKNTDWLRARYRNNSNYSPKESASQLVCILRDSSWVPQTDGRFVRPAEASRALLPKGFPYDEGYEWLKAVSFGEEEQNRSDEHRQKQSTAKELGFSDADSLERAKKFAALPQEEQERILAECQRRQDFELPEHESSASERREELVKEQATEAQERITDQRTRSVSVGLEDVKQETEHYLMEQYTNSDGEMICQICKAQLPFKLDDGSYYFEKVEFLKDLKGRHYQNYLALCPNHSAMFQHVNGSRDVMKQKFAEMVGPQLEIVLAQAEATIYFTSIHIADLRTVIQVDEKEGLNDDQR